MPYLKIFRDIEAKFDYYGSFLIVREYWWVSIVLSFFYLIIILSGKMYMKNKKEFELRRLLYSWNIFLAVFSIIGAYKCVPPLYQIVVERGYIGSCCFTDGHLNPDLAIWTYLFIFSKVWEFVDTFFLVLRKREVIFLHWYHHITVLIFTCYLFKDEVALGHWFGSMNYVIHSIMYSYYAYCTSGRRLPNFISRFVTRMQLGQMFLGLFFTFSSYYGLRSGYPDCMFSERAFWIAMGVYGSYAILFFKFYIERYYAEKKNQ